MSFPLLQSIPEARLICSVLLNTHAHTCVRACYLDFAIAFIYTIFFKTKQCGVSVIKMLKKKENNMMRNYWCCGSEILNLSFISLLLQKTWWNTIILIPNGLCNTICNICNIISQNQCDADMLSKRPRWLLTLNVVSPSFTQAD